MKKVESNFEAAKEFAEFGLKEQRAGRRESASGPGSALASAEPTVELLQYILKHERPETILDLGCGDWNWMSSLGLPSPETGYDIQYNGWDASAELIDGLKGKYGQIGKIDFDVRDITTEPIPKTDLIIARDVLFHVPRHLAERLIERISNSCRLFVANSFLDVSQNTDIEQYLPIKDWGSYQINLNRPPFDLGGKMERAIREPLCGIRGKSRFVCLYKFNDVS